MSNIERFIERRLGELTAENEGLKAENARLVAERDSLVNLMVYDTHVLDDGNSPIPVFGIHCRRHATFSTRVQAIAAVRKAAGLVSATPGERGGA